MRTFLEVGPGNKMAGLVRAILAGQDHHAVSIDASAGKRPASTIWVACWRNWQLPATQ